MQLEGGIINQEKMEANSNFKYLGNGSQELN